MSRSLISPIWTKLLFAVCLAHCQSKTSYSSIAINWHSFASLFHQSCLNIKRRVQILPQCLKSYRSVDVGRAGRFRWQWLALWHWSRCPPRGLCRKRCVWVPLKAARTIPSVITHNAHAHYTKHKKVQKTTELLYYTVRLLWFLFLRYCFILLNLFWYKKRFRWKGKVCTFNSNVLWNAF